MFLSFVSFGCYSQLSIQGGFQSIDSCIDNKVDASRRQEGREVRVCCRLVQTKGLFTLITGGNNPRHMTLMRKHKSLYTLTAVQSSDSPHEDDIEYNFPE